MRIALFDSGVGGLTVLEELLRAYPNEEFFYFGDTANVPYGTKSAEQVKVLSRGCARRVKAFAPDLVVVACNTASSLALEEIKDELFGIPVIGVVEPGARAALRGVTPEASRILLLATRATVRSGAYSRNIQALAGGAKVEVIERECPLLVPLIEEGWTAHAALDLVLDEYLRDQKGQSGIALLGCTHYPWIQAQIARHLPGWRVVNSAEAIVAQIRERFGAGSPKSTAAPRLRCEWSDPAAVPRFAHDFLRQLGLEL